MSKISVRQAHSVSRAQAKEQLASFEEMLKSKYRVSLAWKGDKATVKGIGVSGGVEVSDDAVDVDVKLGMMARAAGVDADRVKASIAKRLKAAFEA